MKTKLTLKQTLVPAFTVIVLTMPVLTAQSQDESLERLKMQYAFSNWVGETRSVYVRPITNWTPDFTRTGLTNLSVEHKTDKMKVYIFDIGTTNDIKVSIFEERGIREAHEAIIRLMAHLSAPLYHEGRVVGLDLGEKCFIGYPTNAPRAVWFVRNNVIIDVCGSDPKRVAEVARRLDEDIRTLSEK